MPTSSWFREMQFRWKTLYVKRYDVKNQDTIQWVVLCDYNIGCKCEPVNEHHHKPNDRNTNTINNIIITNSIITKADHQQHHNQITIANTTEKLIEIIFIHFINMIL